MCVCVFSLVSLGSLFPFFSACGVGLISNLCTLPFTLLLLFPQRRTRLNLVSVDGFLFISTSLSTVLSAHARSQV